MNAVFESTLEVPDVFNVSVGTRLQSEITRKLATIMAANNDPSLGVHFWKEGTCANG
jgi:hypothetical protein